MLFRVINFIYYFQISSLNICRIESRDEYKTTINSIHLQKNDWLTHKGRILKIILYLDTFSILIFNIQSFCKLQNNSDKEIINRRY